MFEVEQKFVVDDFAGIEEKLRERGVDVGPPVEQVDRYFAHPARDFRATDEALRMRQVGAANRITYKGPKLDAHTKTRREIELPLADGDAHAQQWADLLAALGFTPVATVRKHRRVGHVSFGGFTIEAALDDVERVGRYVELEVAADESSLDAARAAVAQVASELGLRNSERRSYLEMLLDSQAR